MAMIQNPFGGATIVILGMTSRIAKRKARGKGENKIDRNEKDAPMFGLIEYVGRQKS
jgi:hypothetical protein